MDPDKAFQALFGKRARKLDAAGRRELLDALAGATTWPVRFVLEVLRLAPASEQDAAWLAALDVLQQLKTLKAQVPVEPPWLLGGLQAAMVSDFAPEPVLVALAREGSDASRDALIADFERCRAGEGGLMLAKRSRLLKRLGQGVPLVDRYLGFRWHSRRDAFHRDASQRNRLAAAGWEELVVTNAMALDQWMETLRALLRSRDPQGELPFFTGSARP